MKRYSITGAQAVVETSAGETILALIIAATTTRPAIFYFSVSAGGTMADQLQRVQVQRITALGTEGAGVVPVALDPGDPASIQDGAEDHSAEPTFTSATELWEQDVHVRATPQIQLQPDSHFVVPATSSNGIAMRSFSTNYGGTAHATMHFID